MDRILGARVCAMLKTTLALVSPFVALALTAWMPLGAVVPAVFGAICLYVFAPVPPWLPLRASKSNMEWIDHNLMHQETLRVPAEPGGEFAWREIKQHAAWRLLYGPFGVLASSALFTSLYGTWDNNFAMLGMSVVLAIGVIMLLAMATSAIVFVCGALLTIWRLTVKMVAATHRHFLRTCAQPSVAAGQEQTDRA